MKLEFVSQYKSIKKFDIVDLDDFSIFTGKNGSGKTQLLQAIKNGNVEFDSFKSDEIVYFNLNTFKTTNTKYKVGQNRISTPGIVYNNFKILMKQFKIQHPLLTDLELDKLDKILNIDNKTLFNINEEEIDDYELWRKIKDYRDGLQTFFARKQFDDPTISTIKKSKNFIGDISKDEFQTNYVSISSINNLILTELGVLFYDYQIKLYEEKYNVNSTADDDTTKKDMDKRAQNKCNAQFGGMPPWDAINKILESYSEMNHKLIEPQKIKLPEYKVDQTSFPVVIKEKFTNAEISPDDLSSGESVLFSLALSVFKENIVPSLPKVLLLDEIDATLHPSMIKNMLRVIDDIFVKKGVKVILSTHSPTTIALCREKSIFIIDNKDEQLIKKQSTKDALDKLTDGFVTIEEGLNLLNMISDKEITIVTEGKNTQYIQKAIDIFNFKDKDKISILQGNEKNSGKTILKTLFDFFSKIKHEKKVIFVFDPDCENIRGKLREDNNTYFYILSKHTQNSMNPGGIETMFDDKFFDLEDLTTTKDGNYITKKTMNKKRKERFMKKMISIADKENFENFKPLLDYLEKIL